MPFPEVKRIIYAKNPLKQVVCQLRFSPILKIDTKIPDDFQERLRKDFPNFIETSELKLEIPKEMEDQVPVEALQHLLQPSGIKNYEFSSEDGLWRVNLTRTFVALTANKYRRWEEFREKLVNPLEALLDIYSPTYFSRVGLRYINVIKRSELGLDSIDWRELLQPYILGVFGSSSVGDQVQKFDSGYEILLEDKESVVRLVTRLVVDEDGEKCYIIDSDFYNTNKTQIDTTSERLTFLNQRSSRLIQWCITPKLHEAMEPELI